MGAFPVRYHRLQIPMIYILLDTIRTSSDDTINLVIEDPEVVIETQLLGEVPELLREVEGYVAKGYWAAGFLSYEAGFAFLPRMPEVRELAFPALWFGLTRNPKVLPQGHLPPGFDSKSNVEIGGLKLNVSQNEYSETINAIREHIERGDTYQVNYTLRYRGNFQGSHRALYHRLRRKQSVAYAALIETPDWVVISLSPELFFRKSGSRVSMRPMKGTAPRGRTVREDDEQATQLSSSIKERSENLMIVDLLRNDLGKVCVPGSIHVTDPLQVERYETVLQMTSTIEGELLPGAGNYDIFNAAFPSGSVTGAPKVRTMQIIHELEQSQRGVYTGAIGYMAPDRSVFNVAIRTTWMDRENESIEMGVGSGILYEADPVREYRECELKGKFLTEPPIEFQIFETMLWSAENGFERSDLHIERMLESATYFDFEVSREVLKQQLESMASGLQARREPHRIRILLHRNGSMECHHSPMNPSPPATPRICFSRFRTNSRDPFQYHKTTNRKLYDSELHDARRKGFFEILFLNERDELTEGAITNVFVLKNGKLYTPPVACGLLAGTFRKHLLESDPRVEESVLFMKDVQEADAIFLSNALRGLIRVECESPEA